MFVGKIAAMTVERWANERAAEADASVDRSPDASPEVIMANHFALLAAESFNQIARMASVAESITMTRRDFVYLTTPWTPGVVK